MRIATVHVDGLGFILYYGGIAKSFECMSRLVDFCRKNDIEAHFEKYIRE